METKYCKKCEKDKLISEFNKDKTTKDGLNSQCKVCYNLYYINNKERKFKTMKIWVENNHPKLLKYRQNYFQENKEHAYNYQKEYNKNKYKEDPIFRLKKIIRSCIRRSFIYSINGNFQKTKGTDNILGCSFEEFKIYLESKFESWMSWENQGLYNSEFNYGWDVDHIIPISSAKTEEDIIRLNHNSNFQPLCSKINREIKKNKLDYGK